MPDVEVVARLDKVSNIAERMALLDPRLRPFTPPPPLCRLNEAYVAASHKLTRTRVKASFTGGSTVGIDNAMAWWPADTPTAPFPGHEVISGFLTLDGINPDSTVVGQVQFHRDVVIWLSWWKDGKDENFISIDWDNVECSGLDLYGTDDDGTNWHFNFSTFSRPAAPAWPFWLLD